MDADLERLIRLQQTDAFIDGARRRIADHPALVQTLDSRLASATENLEAAKGKVAENQVARRAVEKDLAMIQARLGKFKDQLMEVKTNKEYTAMLKEIEVAQHEVRQLEDRVLERMLEADDLAGRQKEAEVRLAADKTAIAAERGQLEEETARLQHELDDAVARRTSLVASVTPSALLIYDTVRGKRGSAVVELRGGYCSACHMRLRPQVANELRRNEIIFQCESCQRIVYFPALPASAVEGGEGTAS
jgi:uncharacterized protein